MRKKSQNASGNNLFTDHLQQHHATIIRPQIHKIPTTSTMKYIKYMLIMAAFSFSYCHASIDFSCAEKTTGGSATISKIYYQSDKDIDDFFNAQGKPSGTHLYLGDEEIDLSDSMIFKENGWSVIRKNRIFVFAFRRVTRYKTSQTDKDNSIVAKADFQYLLANGQRKTVRAGCFIG